MDLKSAANELIRSVGSSELTEIAAEAGDIALDAVVGSGALEQVPMLGWLLKARRATISIRDQIFFKKVCRFLAPVARVSEHERHTFIHRMQSDPPFAHKVGEAFLLWLDRLNSMDKVPYLTRVFHAFILNEIDFDQAAYFADVIDRGYLPYLMRLAPSAGVSPQLRVPEDSALITHFVSLGLMQFEASWEPVERQFRRDVAPQNVQLLRYSLTAAAHVFARTVLASDDKC